MKWILRLFRRRPVVVVVTHKRIAKDYASKREALHRKLAEEVSAMKGRGV